MKQHGPCIYLDTSSKGEKGKQHNRYRADITIRGVRYRRRSKSKRELENWINAMGRGK